MIDPMPALSDMPNWPRLILKFTAEVILFTGGLGAVYALILLLFVLVGE